VGSFWPETPAGPTLDPLNLSNLWTIFLRYLRFTCPLCIPPCEALLHHVAVSVGGQVEMLAENFAEVGSVRKPGQIGNCGELQVG
jgi:hypothetical protein